MLTSPHILDLELDWPKCVSLCVLQIKKYCQLSHASFHVYTSPNSRIHVIFMAPLLIFPYYCSRIAAVASVEYESHAMNWKYAKLQNSKCFLDICKNSLPRTRTLFTFSLEFEWQTTSQAYCFRHPFWSTSFVKISFAFMSLWLLDIIVKALLGKARCKTNC